MSKTRWARGELVGKRLHWLLDLNYAGATIRLSHEDITVTSAEFGDLNYAGVLDSITVSQGVDLFSDSASLLSVKIEAVLPVNVPKLIAEGHDLGAATGVLCQWIEGTDYADRRIVLVGRVRDPKYAASDEPVTFSLEDNLFDDQGVIPDVGAAVTSDTWGSDAPLGAIPYYSSLATAEKGLSYPVIFGTPGKVSTDLNADGWITGSQGVWFWHDLFPDGPDYEGLGLILAGHRVSAEFVYLNTATYTDGYRFLVKHRTDDLGRVVAYVDYRITDPPAPNSYSTVDAVGTYYGLGDGFLDTSFQPDIGEQSDIYAGWLDPINAGAGGMIGSDGELVRGAGDVLEAAMNFSTMAIDRAQIAAVKPYLNRFKIDAVIEAGVKPWEWVRGNLLPILPISVVKGPDGVYFVAWRYDATRADAVAHIDAETDPQIEVAEGIECDTSRLLNDFTLRYALSLRTQTYVGEARLKAAYDPATPDAGVSLHCSLSQRRYRVEAEGANSGVYSEVIESPVLYDTETANAVLAWRALAFCFTKRTVEVLLPENEWGWLVRGQVVTVSIPWLYLDRQVALVLTVEDGDDGMTGVRLLLIEDPPRDARSVP